MRLVKIAVVTVFSGLLLLIVLGALIGSLAPSGAGSTAAAPPRAVGERRASDFGDDWPLTADVGILTCDPRRRDAAVITVNGTAYAMNGIALGLGYPDVKAVQKRDARAEEFEAVIMMSVDTLRDDALDLCGGRP